MTDKNKQDRDEIIEYAKRFPERLAQWKKDHGVSLPPIAIVKDQGPVWLNRSARRKLKRNK